MRSVIVSDDLVSGQSFGVSLPIEYVRDSRKKCEGMRDHLLWRLKHYTAGQLLALTPCIQRVAGQNYISPYPHHGSPSSRYPTDDPNWCPVCGRGTWTEGCHYPAKPVQCCPNGIGIAGQDECDPEPAQLDNVGPITHSPDYPPCTLVDHICKD
jgi:hypothetical protein